MDLPVVCSLAPDALVERLEEWAAVEERGLLSADDGVLRFRRDPGLRTELERLVAAEAECCPTLKLRLEEEPDALVLSVGR